MAATSVAVVPEAAAVWEYLPRPTGHAGPDDRATLRKGLEAALRAGHGAGVRLTLAVDARLGVSVGIDRAVPAAERWVGAVLAATYRVGAWRPASRSRPEPAPWARWVARRRGLPGEREAAPPEPGRLLLALQAALRTGGAGLFVALHLRPAPVRELPLLTAWTRPVERAPATAAPSGRPSRGRVTLGERADGAWAWQVAVDVCATGGPSGVPLPSRLAGVRAALGSLDGRPWTLAPARRDGLPQYRSLLDESELVALFPDEERCAVPPGESLEPRLALGRTLTGTVVAAPVEPEQGRHFAVVGETGMGKSSLLVSVAARASRLGSVVLLDPLGETASALREELAAVGRAPLWVAPEQPGVGTNALAGISRALATDPVRAQRSVEDLVHALRRVRAGRYAETPFWGPRLEEMLGRALRAAALLPSGTLVDAHELLANAGAGRTVVPPSAHAEVRELAQRVRERPDDAEGARRLLYEIVRNPVLRALLCARDGGLPLEQIVAPGRATVFSGEAARVGEATARYLMATYLALLWSELLSRERPTKTFVLLDEAQWFAHESLGEMLRLGRGRNVHLGLATQSLASLPPELQDAVRTNVADLVAFRGSPADAREIGRAVGGLSADPLGGLGRGEALALVGKGEVAVRVRTARLPPRARPLGARPETPGGVPRPAAAVEPLFEDDELVPSMGVGTRRDGLLAELLGRVRQAAADELLEVDVAALRGAGRAPEEALRALGGWLGRSGALVRSERRAGGPVWWIDPGVVRAHGLPRPAPDVHQKRL